MLEEIHLQEQKGNSELAVMSEKAELKFIEVAVGKNQYPLRCSLVTGNPRLYISLSDLRQVFDCTNGSDRGVPLWHGIPTEVTNIIFGATSRRGSMSLALGG